MTPTTTHTHPPRLTPPIELTALPPRPSGYPHELTSPVHTLTTPSPQDPESCTPNHQARIQQQQKLLRLPRLPSCNPLNHKIARFTFQAMLIFGILNIAYQATSLVPAFRSSVVAAQALDVQGDTAHDGRQTLTYGFLQECGNRNVQNLPLGKDCVKYLTKIPKAPPDIDEWMEGEGDAVWNSTTTRLRTRDVNFDSLVTSVDDDDEAGTRVVQSPANFRIWIYIDLICVAVVLVCIWVVKESRQCVQRMLQERILFIRHIMRHVYFQLGRLFKVLMSPSDRAARRIRRTGFILYMLLFGFMFGRWIKQQWRWKVASDFITQCNSQIKTEAAAGVRDKLVGALLLRTGISVHSCETVRKHSYGAGLFTGYSGNTWQLKKREIS
ncbi:hypothetical protein IFR05_003796 [Cadophora sp. M221]|nr:hypothetical protein IFR05_003796 [Cadophora sp. M221]